MVIYAHSYVKIILVNFTSDAFRCLSLGDDSCDHRARLDGLVALIQPGRDTRTHYAVCMSKQSEIGMSV